eukprot:2219158-Rhodomonas_salina.1
MASHIGRCRAIKLDANQAFLLYGLRPKIIIDWNIVQDKSSLTVDKLLCAGLTITQIQQIQPKMSEWIKAGKLTHSHIGQCKTWAIHIPNDCQWFTLMDCIQISHYATTSRMVEIGLSLDVLKDRYGFEYRTMCMMPYSYADWITLGFSFMKHGVEMDENMFYMIFAMTKKQGYDTFNETLHNIGSHYTQGMQR